MDIRWEDIIGHKKNIENLQTLLKEQRLPHALLFCGPDGVGKSKVAVALAATLLCGSEQAPCGRCDSCRALLTDTHPDFYLVVPESVGKTAKSIRIERIREVQTEIARVPILSKRRVVLINDADRMNEAAQNCLLKTLEEPTGQVVFILVVNSRGALLETVQSRCMPMNFGTLLLDEIKDLLLQHGVMESQAAELAALSDGSVGRALLLQENGGMTLRDDVVSFLEKADSMEMEDVWIRGKDLGALSREKLTEWLMYLNMLLRDMLVLYSGGERTILYHQDVSARLTEILTEFPVERIFAVLELVRETQRRLGANVNIRLLMERFLLCMRNQK
jgi:DNA polymerase III subunit delta'